MPNLTIIMGGTRGWRRWIEPHLRKSRFYYSAQRNGHSALRRYVTEATASTGSVLVCPIYKYIRTQIKQVNGILCSYLAFLSSFGREELLL